MSVKILDREGAVEINITTLVCRLGTVLVAAIGRIIDQSVFSELLSEGGPLSRPQKSWI